MNCQDLTRRELLLTAATGAGVLLGHGALRTAQAADRTPLIPRKLLFAGADRSTVRISPDGRRIAFMAPIDGVLNLWVGEIDNLAKARPLTRVADRDLGPWIVWLHNNRHIVFFRDQGGDENWQAHRVDVSTGDILALTPGPGVKSYIQQTSRHFPDELLIAHNQRDPRFSDIFRVNVPTGASALLLANDQFAWIFTDPQFRVRFGVRQTDAGDTEYLQRGAGGDWELLTLIDMADAMTTRAIEFSDDGTELYWLDSRGRDKAVLVGEDLKTGAKRILAEDPKADLVEVMLEPRSYRPFAAAASAGRCSIRPIGRIAPISPRSRRETSPSRAYRPTIGAGFSTTSRTSRPAGTSPTIAGPGRLGSSSRRAARWRRRLSCPCNR
jgi:dipeptidyl aminopeptidase/acylaminoacyl peptidase